MTRFRVMRPHGSDRQGGRARWLSRAHIRTSPTPRRGSGRRCSRRSASSRPTALRGDPGAAAPGAAARDRAGRRLRGRAAPQARRHARSQSLGPRPVVVPGRWLLAALRPRRGRRDRRARGVPHRLLRRDVLRSRQAAGVLRVREPRRRPRRVRRRLADDVRLGVGRRQRDPDGRPADRTAPRARAGVVVARAALDHHRHLRGADDDRRRRLRRRDSGALDLAALDAALRRRRRLRLPREPGLPRHLEPDAAAIMRARARARRARPWSASTRSRSACSRRRRATAPTSSAASCRALGIHMHYGGGTIGFIASADDERIVARVPDVPDRRRPHRRGRVGLRRGAVGPDGLRAARRGAGLHRHDDSRSGRSASRSTSPCSARTGCASSARRSCSAASTRRKRLGELPGVRSPALSAPFFKEFVVDFSGTRLHGRRRQPGARRGRHPRLARPLAPVRRFGQSALVCVTEVHTKEDIDRLADTLAAAMTEERR